MPAWLRAADGGSELTLHIQPGASKSELAGLHGDALKLRIQAPPVEGAANAALLAFVAKRLGIAAREVKLLRGDKSRRKTVWVALAPDQVQARLTAG
ncbi:MAG: YggU family protein [Hydrogenophilaceae bacterium]|nr:YggU family protein [Hydrogenophilaceae bacterium]